MRKWLLSLGLCVFMAGCGGGKGGTGTVEITDRDYNFTYSRIKSGERFDRWIVWEDTKYRLKSDDGSPGDLEVFYKGKYIILKTDDGKDVFDVQEKIISEEIPASYYPDAVPRLVATISESFGNLDVTQNN